MRRFRSTWLALMGGALLATLSISAAFGADPADTHDETRGQTIAAFVHHLVFGTDERPEDEAPVAAELEEEESDAHGACVSGVAQDPEAIGGPSDNHGGAVSEAARVTCWETDDPEEVTGPEEDEETLEEEEEEADEEDDSHGACVSAVARDKNAIGGKNENHGGAVSEAARVTCREGTEEEEAEESVESEDTEAASDKQAAKAEKQAAKASHAGGKPSWAGNGAKATGKGGGNGRAGRP